MSITVRLLPGGNHTTTDGRQYVAGDVFEVTEAEFNSWKGIRFEEAAATPEVSTPANDDDTADGKASVTKKTTGKK